MNACEYLARVGFAELLGTATPVYDDDPYATDVLDHRRVREMLLQREPIAYPEREGVTYIRPITWPDRVPGLKVWAGQQTLAKIIRKLQDAVRHSGLCGDLFELRVPMQWVTGFDCLAAQHPRDLGFSPAAIGMKVLQRPALELLAIVGLEVVPLVSYGRRDCGFLHGGRMWRFRVEPRAGGYYHRWGRLSEASPVSEPPT